MAITVEAGPLPVEQSATTGFTHVARIKYTDLTDTADTAKTLELFNVGAGKIVRRAAHKVITEFDGGATSALNMTVGDGGDVDRFIGNGTTTVELHADDTVDTYSEDSGQGTVPYEYTSSDTVDAVFTSTGGNLSVLTQGEVEVYIQIVDYAGMA